jgi:hypothetical protein
MYYMYFVQRCEKTKHSEAPLVGVPPATTYVASLRKKEYKRCLLSLGKSWALISGLNVVMPIFDHRPSLSSSCLSLQFSGTVLLLLLLLSDEYCKSCRHGKECRASFLCLERQYHSQKQRAEQSILSHK